MRATKWILFTGLIAVLLAGCRGLTDPVVSVTGVSLNKTATTITVGGTEQLTATVVPADAMNATVTWSSSSDAVATVSTTGLVTAVAAGSATITVTTSDGGFTAACTVTVPVPNRTISFDANGGSGTMSSQTGAEGSTVILTANAFTRTGYIFAGWATSASGGVTYNDGQSIVMGSSDVPLYAVWTVSTALVLHYDFNAQNCTDVSGNSRDGTATDVTYVTEGTGYAASFNGTTSYIAMPTNTLASLPEFTVMLRFKADATQTGGLLGYQTFAVGTSYTASATYVPVLAITSDGKLRGELWAGTQLQVLSTAAVNDGAWHTVYFSAKPNSIALYLDGTSIETKTGTVNHVGMTVNEIGASPTTGRLNLPTGWAWFNGLVDDFYLYSQALH